MANPNKKPVHVSLEVYKQVQDLAIEKDLTVGDMADALLKTAAGRRAAVNKYARTAAAAAKAAKKAEKKAEA